MKRSEVVMTDNRTGAGVAAHSAVRTSSNAYLERRQDDVVAGAASGTARLEPQALAWMLPEVQTASTIADGDEANNSGAPRRH